MYIYVQIIWLTDIYAKVIYNSRFESVPKEIQLVLEDRQTVNDYRSPTPDTPE